MSVVQKGAGQKDEYEREASQVELEIQFYEPSTTKYIIAFSILSLSLALNHSSRLQILDGYHSFPNPSVV